MAARSEDRPWIPSQIVGISFLFGPLVGGAIAGINFARLGKQQYLIPPIIIGFVLFLIEAWAIVFLINSGETARILGPLVNVGIGFGFMLIQKPFFDAWKAANWTPTKEGERYKPNRLGQLFLVSLGCLAIEVGVIFLFVVLGGKW